MTHRQLDEDNARNRDIVSERTLQYIDQMIKRIVEFRTRKGDLDGQTSSKLSCVIGSIIIRKANKVDIPTV